MLGQLNVFDLYLVTGAIVVFKILASTSKYLKPLTAVACTKPLSTIQCNKTLCRDQLVPILLIG